MLVVLCEDLCLIPDPKYKESNLGMVSLRESQPLGTANRKSPEFPSQPA